MQRAPISVEALRTLINTEFTSLAPCVGVEVALIEVRSEPDARGCNWRVGTFADGDPTEPCASLASLAFWELQWRYNVSGWQARAETRRPIRVTAGSNPARSQVSRVPARGPSSLQHPLDQQRKCTSE